MGYQIREHQKKAVKAIKESIDSGINRLLIQMVQGSGIIYTCFAAMNELIKEYGLSKIKIISDKLIVIEQLKHIQSNFWSDEFKNCSLDIKTYKSTDDKIIKYDLLIIFNIRNNYDILTKYIKCFKGIVIIFWNEIDASYEYRYKEIGFKLVYKYSIQDAINNVPDILKDNNIKLVQEGINNISNIIFRSQSRFDHKSVQMLGKETRLILNNFEELSNNYIENKQLVSKIIANNITLSDLDEIGYRRIQLNIFKNLLQDDLFFKKEKDKLGSGAELVWQNFFEKNTWILGYGMTQVYHSSLNKKKLEQVVAGFDVNSAGKRIDSLMKSKGFIENLCFIELKTHKTPLLHKKPYRKECFQPSLELSGAISQIQKTVNKALGFIKDKLEIQDNDGNPTGEIVYNYAPKSYLIIGCLREFATPNGVNKVKYSSFELFRKNLNGIEIITFDELYEKAKFIAIYH